MIKFLCDLNTNGIHRSRGRSTHFGRVRWVAPKRIKNAVMGPASVARVKRVATLRCGRKRVNGTKALRTEYEKYKCELCEVCFSQKKSVLRHQQQVHGRKPGPKRKKNQGTVGCEYCDKLFYDKRTVIKHRKRVHKIY